MERASRFRRLFQLDRGAAGVAGAVDDELAFHFDMAVADLTATGMPADEARREAERRFGDVQGTRRALAEIGRARAGSERRARWGSAVAHDLRYAIRGLRRKPGFTLGVMLTLGLGIGANATMFGVVDRLLFRPPAYLPQPGEVNRVYFARTFDGEERAIGNTSYRRFQDIRRNTRSFSEIAAYFRTEIAIGTGESAREMEVATVSADFWRIFEAPPARGRYFGPDEDRPPAGTAVTVLGHEFWQTEFGGGEVLGERIRIGYQDYMIVGVAPRGFQGMWMTPTAAYIPITAGAAELSSGAAVDLETEYGFNWMELLVRRKPDVTVEAASTDLSRAFAASYAAQREIMPQIEQPEIAKPRAMAASVLRERGPNRTTVAKVATWLVGVSLVVLIIACANVGNLLLARALNRRREIAVRLALGVSRSRLLGQLLLESVLLAILGGAAGLLLAQWGGQLIRATLLPNVAWGDTVFDRRVLLFTAAAAILAGVFAGLAPVLQTRRADVAAALKTGTREGTYHKSGMRMGLLVLQCALSVVLLVGAGLFVRSFRNVSELRLGYEPDRVLYVSTQMRGEDLPPEEADRLKERLLAGAQALPAVEQATRTLSVPFWISVDQPIFVPGIDSASRLGIFTMQAVSPGYFQTMGTRLLGGRAIGHADGRGTPPVMVVSASMARVLWPGQSALGRCVKLEADTMPCTTVVGVAEDIKRESLTDDPGLLYYLSISQYAPGAGGLFVRTRGPADEQADAVRRALQGIMPGSAYVSVTPMADIVDPNLQSWKLGATMFTAFGVLALIVAAVGLYSVIAYNVSQRTHELGVRVALGARTTDVVRIVLADALRLAAVAVVLGTLAVLYAGRWIEPLLFGTSARDPMIIAGIGAGILAIAALASFAPALRAARVDPATALRAD
jgi:predicted permease